MIARYRTVASALVIAIAGAAVVGAATVLGLSSDLVAHTWDLLWPDGSASHRVVVVAIDQPSLDTIGPWPWTSAEQAALLRGIDAQRPAAIGYDILLGDSSKPGFPALVEAIDSSPTSVARAFSSIRSTGLGVYQAASEVRVDFPTAVARFAGHTLVVADDDGVIRTSPLVIEAPDGQFLPSLALQTVARAAGASGSPVVRPGSVDLGAVRVPAEADAAMRVHWVSGLSPGDEQVISAASILDGASSSALLKNAIVMVGVTAPATGDEHVTPLAAGAATPGVLVQAQVADTIVAAKWVAPAPAWWSMLATLLLGFACGYAALRLRLRWLIVTVVSSLVVYMGIALAAFASEGILPDLVRVPVAIIGVAVAALCVRLVREQRRRAELASMFASYVPDASVAGLLESGPGEAGRANSFDAAVMFCDLRGFTALASGMDLDDARAILDMFYEFVYSTVTARGGVVIKFVGDEVMAVFRTAPEHPQPAADALEAARVLQSDGEEFRARLAAASLPGVRFGIGMHLGSVLAAHIGPAGRRQFDVVGDTVNVASRLCALAGTDEIVVSRHALGPALPDLGSERVRVKGKDEPIEVVKLSLDRQT